MKSYISTLAFLLCVFSINTNAKYEMMMPSNITVLPKSEQPFTNGNSALNPINSKTYTKQNSSDSNNSPSANNDNGFVTNNETPLDNMNILSNDFDPDGDPLTIENAIAANGKLDINPDGTLRYKPKPGFQGTDTITYKINDGKGGSDSAVVEIIVKNNTSEESLNGKNSSLESATSKKKQEQESFFKFPFKFGDIDQTKKKIKDAAHIPKNAYKSAMKEIKSEIKDLGCKFVYQKYIIEKKVPASYSKTHNWNNWSSFDITQFEDLILKCK